MNTENVEKKLREARFFLDWMIEQEGLTGRDKEPFDFLLSAFLNAARSVDYRLRHEHRATYPDWRKTWDEKFPLAQGFVKLFVDDRNLEVHQTGSSRSTYNFTIDGVGRSTTLACTEYLALLDRIVAEFKSSRL